MDSFFLSLHRFRWGVRAAASVMLVVLCIIIAVNALNGVPRECDFTIFYAGAKAYFQGLPLLQPFTYIPFFGDVVLSPPRNAPLEIGHMADNLNPPVVMLLALPLNFFSLKVAYFIWAYTQLIVALGVWLSLLPSRAGVRALGCLVFCAFFPVLANAMVGQMGLFLFAALGGFVYFSQRQRFALAGVLLGIALCLKLFVGLLFIALLMGRHYRIIIYGSATWLLCNLMALVVFGWQNHLDWILLLQAMPEKTFNWNVSLSFLLSRHIAQDWLRLGFLAAAWVLALMGVWHVARQKDQLNLLIGLCLPLMLLLAPLSWLYYAPMVLISALLSSTGLASLEKKSQVQIGWVLGLGLSLLAVPQFLRIVEKPSWDITPIHFADPALVTENGKLMLEATDSFRWLVLSEIYPLGLGLIALALFFISKKDILRRKG